MDIHKLHRDVLGQLKAGKRPRLELSGEDVAFLLKEWENSLSSPEKLRPLMAVLDYCRREHPEFQELLVKTVLTVQDPEILVFALAAFQKHVIGLHQKRGERYSGEILECLKTALEHPHPEVKEWTLRTIDQIGPQSVVFRDVLTGHRTGFLQSLLPRQRVIKKLIKTIERGWRAR